MEFLIFLLLLVGLSVATVAASVKTVPQGYQWIVERFGRYRKTLPPGLNFVLPYIDRVRSKLNVQQTVLEIPSQLVISKDNASIIVDGVVFYQIVNPSKAVYQV
jgi:regulator of protease activity HflC (stomatin/prohibitin superfamily)